MLENRYLLAGIVFAASWLLTLLITHLILPVLQAKKIGQPISQYVGEHKNKDGTPTMGGICFILSILLCMTVAFVLFAVQGIAQTFIPLALTLALGVGNGIIGFVDDYAKLLKKENIGLSVMQKLVLQFAVAGAYVAVMAYTGNLPTTLALPFCDYALQLSYAAYPIYAVLIVGFVNSTNITDGIDGLASSVALVVALFYLIASFALRDSGLSFISAALMGGMIGFLHFNRNPARIFMGDTGSLFIGGILMGMAFMTGEVLVLMIAGLVYICEMLSSLLQVVYFKLTGGKRLFRMAPIHHHFQKGGWSEVRITLTFAAVTALLCVVAWLGLIL